MEDGIVKDIPETENGSNVNCNTMSGKRYIITQNLYKREHTLWKIVDGGYIRIDTSDNPYDLYPMIPWNE